MHTKDPLDRKNRVRQDRSDVVNNVSYPEQ